MEGSPTTRVEPQSRTEPKTLEHKRKGAGAPSYLTPIGATKFSPFGCYGGFPAAIALHFPPTERRYSGVQGCLKVGGCL